MVKKYRVIDCVKNIRLHHDTTSCCCLRAADGCAACPIVSISLSCLYVRVSFEIPTYKQLEYLPTQWRNFNKIEIPLAQNCCDNMWESFTWKKVECIKRWE